MYTFYCYVIGSFPGVTKEWLPCGKILIYTKFLATSMSMPQISKMIYFLSLTVEKRESR